MEDSRKQRSLLNNTATRTSNNFSQTPITIKSPDLETHIDVHKKVSEVITVPKNLDRPKDPNQTTSFKIYTPKPPVALSFENPS